MAGFDYDAWRASLERAISALMAGFESRFGFPPDEHTIGAPTGDNLLEQASTAGVVPDVLLELYRHVGEVSLPDVYNGYFVHPLGQVLESQQNGSPVRAPGVTDNAIVVFGSDGGGSLFALDGQGAPVYLLPPGAVRDRVYTGGLEAPGVLAPTLADFLRWIQSRVEMFVA